MSSMIHGIRILDKKDRVLTFQTFLIYSDWNSLPRTHGFGLLVLEDKARETANRDCALYKEAPANNFDFINKNYEVAQKYISRLEVSNFENFPPTAEFMEASWHYIDEKTGKFHAEEHLPQATYNLEATDAKWIEHLKVGDQWETTACDLDGPSWYLEQQDDKSSKFYHVYQKSGTWYIRYGKLGTPGRKEQKYMYFDYAEKTVKEKIKKGYVLVYQNFDTRFGHEEKLARENKVKAKAESKPVGNEAMLKAVEAEDVQEVKRLLESGLDPNECTDKYDKTILENVATGWEINGNTIAIARLLLEHGADPNKGRHEPFFPSVCYFGRSEELIRLLIEFGADITLHGGYDDHSVLHSASVSGLTWLVKDGIAQGVDVMHRSAQGHTALHYAAESKGNAIEIIDLLLAQGAQLDDCNGEWGTPLFWAAGREGKPETIKHLVKLGAEINAQTPKGNMPIHNTAQYGHAENFATLLELGAKLDPDKNGLPIMHILMERLLSYTEEISETAMKKIELMHSKGHSLQPDSPSGSTSAGELLSKVKSAANLKDFQVDLVMRLLDMGFDPYEADPKGFSLVHYAAKINHTEILQKCLAMPGNINAQDEYGWTALHYAACYKDKVCAKMLVAAGADESVKTKKQRTFLKKKFASKLTALEL